MIMTIAGASPNEPLSPPEGQELFLNFLTTFLVVTLQRGHLCGPLYLALSRCDPLYVSAFHYHMGPFHPVMEPFYPCEAPVGEVRGWSAPALIMTISKWQISTEWRQTNKHEILRDERQLLPVFNLRSAKPHTATPVVSLPVPAVVGTTSKQHLSIRWW